MQYHLIECPTKNKRPGHHRPPHLLGRSIQRKPHFLYSPPRLCVHFDFWHFFKKHRLLPREGKRDANLDWDPSFKTLPVKKGPFWAKPTEGNFDFFFAPHVNMLKSPKLAAINGQEFFIIDYTRLRNRLKKPHTGGDRQFGLIIQFEAPRPISTQTNNHN